MMTCDWCAGPIERDDDDRVPFCSEECAQDHYAECEYEEAE